MDDITWTNDQEQDINNNYYICLIGGENVELINL